MNLPITLTSAAAVALMNLWLMWRCGAIRTSRKILHGDGGDPLLSRRMRAHSNFIESAPVVLILVAVLEMVRGTEMWLWIVAYLYLLVRIAHPFGMDSDRPSPLRMIGAAGTMLALLVLAIVALVTVYGALL